MKTIKVQIKYNYGRRDVYPLGELGEQICRLTGKKTIDANHISALKNLGFEIEQDQEKIKI